MLTVSSRFLAALREPHTISVAAYVYRPSAPTTPIQVPVIDGQVTLDRDARIRRQGSLAVAFELDDTTTQQVVRELPFGGYATVERGIQYADGSSERVQLGRFRVDAVAWSALQGQATLTLNDRMAQIQDEPFLAPYAPAGKAPTVAAEDAVKDVFGSSILYHRETDWTAEPLITSSVYEEDRAAAVADLARSVGAEALFDQLGDFVIRPRDRTLPVAWVIDADTHGVMTAVEETLDRSNVRNGVVVMGQAAADQAPLYSLAVYDDPASLVRWGGPFGKVALIETTSAVTSQAQADAAAQTLLNKHLGLARTLTIRAVPNPALEPGDLIELVFPDGREEQQTVNTIRVGLGVSGELELATSGGYFPEALSLMPRRLRWFNGAAAWRELADARLVEAS